MQGREEVTRVLHRYEIEGATPSSATNNSNASAEIEAPH